MRHMLPLSMGDSFNYHSNFRNFYISRYFSCLHGGFTSSLVCMRVDRSKFQPMDYNGQTILERGLVMLCNVTHFKFTLSPLKYPWNGWRK